MTRSALAGMPSAHGWALMQLQVGAAQRSRGSGGCG
jgi:hypothetical protein